MRRPTAEDAPATPATTPVATTADAGATAETGAPATATALPTTFAGWRRALGPAGPLALVSATLPPLGGFALLGLITSLEPHLQAWGPTGIFVYIAFFALTSGLAILPTYAQAVLGGWVYKMPLGLFAALAGVLGGALLGYGIGRRASGERLMQLIRTQPKWLAVRDALVGSGWLRTLLIVFLLRLHSPFAFTNFVLAATRTNWLAYALGTVLGLAPRTLAFVLIAASMNELSFAQNRWLLIGTIVITLIVLMIIGSIAKKAIERVTGTQGAKRKSAAEKPACQE